MKRSTFLNLAFGFTVLAVGTAMVFKMINAPPGAKIVGGDTFALISPVFFVMAAKKATRFGGAAVVIALIGMAFAGLGLWGATLGAKTPDKSAVRRPR